MTSEFCPERPFVVPYLEYAVLIPVFILFQSLLLINTIHKEYKKNIYLHDVSPVVRISFIALQLCGLYWSIVDLLRFVVDPHTDVMQNNLVLCNIVAYSPKLIVIIYYGIYLHQILFRLEASFKDSCLEFTKCTKYTLYMLLYVPLILIPSVFFVYLSPKCIWIWYPSDFPHWKHMSFCDAPMNKHAGIVMLCGMIWVGIANLLFCVMFAQKLRTILGVRIRSNSGRSAISGHQFTLKTVMIKNSILVGCASCFTLMNWISWLYVATPLGFGATLLYLDIAINLVLVAMMFKYNDTYYRVLCKCCIKKCFKDCDKSYNQENTDQIRIQLELYFKGVRLSHIASQYSSRCGSPNSSVQDTKTSRKFNTVLSVSMESKVSAKVSNGDDVTDITGSTSTPVTPNTNQFIATNQHDKSKAVDVANANAINKKIK